MNRSNTLSLLGFSAIIVGLIALAAWYYYVKVPALHYSSSNTSIADTLTQTNTSFVEADNLFKTKEYGKAIAGYQEALSSVTDASQKQIIDMRIARATYLNGDSVGAIQQYKQIAMNTESLTATRAYAVMYMGQMYYSTLDPAITNEIFKDEPYKTFFVAGDIDLSYRHLFENSNSFYSLPISELRIADWYARRIAELYKKSPISPEIAADKKIVDEKIASANAKINQIQLQSNPTYTTLIPGALRLKAETISWLSFAGVASSTMAEAAFQDALASNSKYRPELTNGDAYIRYSFAWLLATTYGNKRSDDIIKLLKPLYTESDYGKSSIVLFFQNARKYDAISKNEIRSVALIDLGFKTYLISLGWETSDFK